MHLIILFHTEVSQARATLQSKLLVLNKAHVGIPTQFEVRPLLVYFRLLAIHNFLDFLVLCVCFDEFPSSESFGIAKLRS